MKKIAVLVMAIILAMCFAACSDEDTIAISGNTVYLDGYIEFTLPDEFAATATEEKAVDENGDLSDAFWGSDEGSLSAFIGEAEADSLEAIAEENLSGEIKTYGDNKVYIEDLSEETLKYYRSVYVMNRGKLIQIDWESNGELTDESVRMFEEILTNMKLL